MGVAPLGVRIHRSPGDQTVIRLFQIDRSSPLYPQEVELRTRVLLTAVGLDIDSFEAAYPGVEERFVHFVAATESPGGDRVLACALLLPDTPQQGQGKVMQVAVDPQRQGEGLGRKIMASVEKHAFADLNLNGLACHAQVTAAGFYESLGWTREGEQFEEAGIPHYKMVLPAPDRAAIEPAPDAVW